MLQYEWGNPSPIMLSGEEHPQESDPNRTAFYNYPNQEPSYAHTTAYLLPTHQHDLPSQNLVLNYSHPTPFLYDPRACTGAPGSYSHSGQPSFSLDHGVPPEGGSNYFLLPKSEDVSRPLDFGASKIGLNLGGRTFYSSADDDFVNRLYRRSRTGDPGSLSSLRCQAEGCNADLSHAKHYHRRHKVCEYHSKASNVIAAGFTQRFCQQCSRFHPLSEFDNGKRSCRKRLADHNRRRRKSHQIHHGSPKQENSRNSFSDNTPRSPQDSGAQSSPSVTIPASPRISLDCFGPYNARASSVNSASSSSLFFSSG